MQPIPCVYRISIKALIEDQDGQILLIRHGDGGWELPGGGLEHGESPAEGLARELKEELGIEVGELKYLSSHIGEYLFSGINHKLIGITYWARLPSGIKITPADDVAAVKFYKLSDAPLDQLASDSDRKMVEILKNQLAQD